MDKGQVTNGQISRPVPVLQKEWKDMKEKENCVGNDSNAGFKKNHMMYINDTSKSTVFAHIHRKRSI